MHYLVVSHENFCVYTSTSQLVIANALASSSIDCFIRGVTSFNLNNYNKFTNPKEFYENIWKNDYRAQYNLVPVDPSQVNENWLKNREIIKRRHILFSVWDSHTSNALARVDTTKWPAFSAVAETEIKQCDSDKGIFTPMIAEYARISERPVAEVFDELKLKIETENLAKFRITALAEKFKDKINQAITQEDMDQVKAQMYIEFWGNAIL